MEAAIAIAYLTVLASCLGIVLALANSRLKVFEDPLQVIGTAGKGRGAPAHASKPSAEGAVRLDRRRFRQTRERHQPVELRRESPHDTVADCRDRLAR